MENHDNPKLSLPFARLKLLRNAATVKRCHTVVVSRQQNVGEHSFSVLAILDFIEPLCSKELWRAALHHDALEAITGDIPATAKWRYPELSEALKGIEKHLNLEYDLEHQLSSDEADALKYADSMELILYSLEEMRLGNHEGASIASRVFDHMEKKGLNKINSRAEWLYDIGVAEFESLGGERE